MTGLTIVPIIEGHGEVDAIRILLDRIWREIAGGSHVDLLFPIRKAKTQIVQQATLSPAVRYADRILRDQETSFPRLILLLLDSDGEPPCEVGPELLSRMREETDLPVACVLAHYEFETWFVGAAESLTRYLDLSPSDTPVEDPETARAKKRWIAQRFRKGKYRPSIDQPRLTQAMDLALARARCPSFDKLCRELETCRDMAKN